MRDIEKCMRCMNGDGEGGCMLEQVSVWFRCDDNCEFVPMEEEE